MGKSRMTVLDVKASVASLRNQLLGARVANVYDLDAKTYLLKCAKGGVKTMVLLESGIRFHSTEFMRDKSNMPSGFSLKLRKHIRTKRVEEVRQIGDDRVVAFTFGAGDEAVHLVLELFAGGNIILLNHEHVIMVLLRTHTDEASGARTAVREAYPLNQAPAPRRITSELLLAAVERTAANPKLSIKDALSKELDYGPALVEHALLTAEVDPKRKASDLLSIPASSAEITALLTAFESVDGIIEGLAASSEGQTVPGVIIRKAADEESAYDDFAPVVLKQHAGKALVHFESFDKAMDAFFTVLEDKKIIEQKVQQQKAAIGKVERVRKAHEASVAALESEKDTQYHKAMLIEANLGDVDNAILVVNSLLSQGTDWNALKKIIKEETRKGNPVAQIIHSLKLDTNQITLQLTFGLDELDEESQTAPVTAVDVDLGLNAYTNAQNYYQTKKKVQAKMEKTQASQGRALKGAERKAKQELKSVEVKSAIQQVRKQHWFEKFIYFVSSENFLVLAGRDAQQNELLVKRHMDKGDVYLHADIHGAATHIIKNHTKDPVPPLTLAQVSKSAPTGEYLSTGSFMIRGKKNYLPPNSLVMGFGLLFKVDESCLAMHVGERKIRGLGDGDTEAGSVWAAEDEIGEDLDALGMSDEEKESGAVEEAAQGDVGGARDGGGTGLSEDKVASLTSAGGASSMLYREMAGACSVLRTTTGDNLDVGTRDFDGMRVGAVSMAAFEEEEEEAEVDAMSHIPEALRPAAVQRDQDGKNRGQNRLSVSERKKLKKRQGTAGGQADGGAEGADGGGGAGDGKEGATKTNVVKGFVGQLTTGAVQSGNVKGENAGGQKKGKSSVPPQPPTASKRGSNAKKKKMAKYADQDEDERRVALKMLGVLQEEEPEEEAGRDGQSVEAEGAGNKEMEATGLAAAVEERLFEIIGQGKAVRKDFDASTLGKLGEFADGEALEILDRFAEADILDKVKNKAAFLSGICHRFRDRNDKQAKKEMAAEKREIEQLNSEEGILELDAEEKAALIDLDSFTAMPLPADILHYALPVCCPYFAMQSYKFKVKLTPAMGKKGKVAKQAQQMFLKDATSRERELIKAMSDHEMVMQMISNCRISAGAAKGSKK